MSILYITSDRPGAGKTALAGALATELSRAGKVVGYLKPFSDSPQSDPDVAFMGLSLSSADGDGSIAPTATHSRRLGRSAGRRSR